jgi:ADP-ribose pyrophosphatase YjhB (NUDIX family)
MNMLDKQIEVKQHCLERLTQADPYPNYPTERFICDMSQLEFFTIPNGPWDTEPFSPLDNYSSDFINKSLRIDKLGRPLHPWVEDIASSVGVVAGRGFYRNFGPNYTVDPLVITDEKDPHILLVLRGDNKCWALPGGFLEHIAESTTDANKRECLEETDVYLDGDPVETVYIGPVADERSTAHSWAYTTAKLWRPDKRPPTKPQIEEVDKANWFPIDCIPANLHGSHAKIIEFALRDLQ